MLVVVVVVVVVVVLVAVVVVVIAGVVFLSRYPVCVSLAVEATEKAMIVGQFPL